MDALDVYRKKLQEAVGSVKSRSGGEAAGPFFNRSIDHASAMLKAVFDSADKTVCVLAGDCRESVYNNDELIVSVLNFLKKPGAKLRVLLDDCHGEKGDSDDYFSILAKRGEDTLFGQIKSKNLSGRVSICCVPDEISIRYKYHFTVADGLSYRFELDKQELKAIGFFNNKSEGAELLSKFDEIWNICNNN